MEITQTQESILRLAADYASEHGLNDLTIGKLATAAGMSKAGLHGSFGSKIDLQLSTIRYAAEIFQQKVISPTRNVGSGVKRIDSFCNAWMSYIDRKVFPGGCFFGRVSMEGASLAENVNSDIRKRFQSFRKFISIEISKGIGTKKANSDSYDFADQLLALIVSYNWAVHSLRNAVAARHIRELVSERLRLISGMKYNVN